MSTDSILTPEELLVISAPIEDSLPELTLGTGEPSDGTLEVEAAPVIIRGKLDKDGTGLGTGRRKTSVARVRIKDGTGKITVNGREFAEYFRIERDRFLIEQPLVLTEKRDTVDVFVRANGGGITGQTGAVVLGIARALEARLPSLHRTLAENGFLTRDDRMVERKKYGHKKARKSFQFSKR